MATFVNPCQTEKTKPWGYSISDPRGSIGCTSGTKFCRPTFCFPPKLTLGLNSSRFWGGGSSPSRTIPKTEFEVILAKVDSKSNHFFYPTIFFYLGHADDLWHTEYSTVFFISCSYKMQLNVEEVTLRSDRSSPKSRVCQILHFSNRIIISRDMAIFVKPSQIQTWMVN